MGFKLAATRRLRPMVSLPGHQEKGDVTIMSSFWKQIALLLMAILEQLVNMPPDQDHTQIAAAGLATAKRLLPKEADHA